MLIRVNTIIDCFKAEFRGQFPEIQYPVFDIFKINNIV